MMEQLSENAIELLTKRYLKKTDGGELIETPDEMFWRVAKNIAKAEKIYDENANVEEWAAKFHEVMSELDFLPNSPTLMNAGNILQQLSGCFVLPIEDSMESIFDAVKSSALIHKSGGGCCKKGTLVWTKNPGLKPIEEIPVGTEICALDTQSLKTVWTKVLETHKYKVDEAYEVEVEGHSRVCTSPWHPFLSFNGVSIVEKRADELTTEDWILTPLASIEMLNDNLLDAKLAWLIGFFIGDGNFSSQGIRFSVSSKLEQKRVNDYLYELFGRRYTVQKEGTVPYISVVRSDIVEVFRTYCKDKKSKTARIHDGLLVSRDVLPLIAGLFDADGWSSNGRLCLEVTSPKLAEQVNCVFSLLGIHSIITKHLSGKNSYMGSCEIWRVQISSKSALELFTQMFGNYLQRVEIPEKQWDNQPCNLSPDVDTLNDGTTSYYNWKKGQTDISLGRALRITKGEKIKSMLRSARRVKMVKRVEGGEFYDFTTREGNYVAGRKGLMLVHNTGFSFSRIRPRGDCVKTTSGMASGPISFMHVFNAATEAVKQGGTRRGANMGILRIDHPDILEFIDLKKEEGHMKNFNLSVGVTDEFMKALREGVDFGLRSPRTSRIVQELDPQYIFNKIVEGAWRNGEPGIIFLDRIQEDNPTPLTGKIESTNPCGEQPLLPNESCNLGSINLSHMVKDGYIDEKRLKRVIQVAVRFLDNAIDMNHLPLKIIGERTKATRKIGLGVMGFADMLILLGIPYNADGAVETAERVMSFINHVAKKESMKLAEERGAFPEFENSVYYKRGEAPIRNATITTIAPTGSLSIIADCSSGIEPLFSISYIHVVMEGQKLVRTNPEFERVAREGGFYSEALMAELAQRGTVQNIGEVPDDVKKVFVTARDITPEWHVIIQASFQKWIDNAVSKTINLPHSATTFDVDDIITLAYDVGCKGITVYRDGSRKVQVLRTHEAKT